MFNRSLFFRGLCLFVAAAVFHASFLREALAAGEALSESVSAGLSETYSLPFMRGVKFYPDNPFELEFIVDQAGHKDVSMQERQKLLRYFLAALTIPEDKLWVNLSPYESGRIIEDTVAQTEIGETLLEQDYLLKQLSASLTHPDTPTGKKYWYEINNPSSINHNSETGDLSKIWIKPQKVSVYDEHETIFITDMVFKLESESGSYSPLMPALTKDVNDGRNFSPLRQMVYSIILAQWFKRKFARSLYAFYFDAEKTAGIDVAEPGLKEKVFEKYVAAFDKGAYNMTKKVHENGRLVKRKYFCGGAQTMLYDIPQREKVSGSALNNSFGSQDYLALNTRALARNTSSSVPFARQDDGYGSISSAVSPVRSAIDKLLNEMSIDLSEDGIREIEERITAVASISADDGSWSIPSHRYSAVAEMMRKVLPREKAGAEDLRRYINLILLYAENLEENPDIFGGPASSVPPSLQAMEEFLTGVSGPDRAEQPKQDPRKAAETAEMIFMLPVNGSSALASSQTTDAQVRQENVSGENADFTSSSIYGGIDLSGMLDGVKVYESSSAIRLAPEVTENITGVIFRIIGKGQVLPLNQIINLPPAL